MIEPPARSLPSTAVVVSTALSRLASRFARQAAATSLQALAQRPVRRVAVSGEVGVAARHVDQHVEVGAELAGHRRHLPRISRVAGDRLRADLRRGARPAWLAVRPVMNTVSPAARNRAATALPSPFPPPVTSTIRFTRSSSLPDMFSSKRSEGGGWCPTIRAGGSTIPLGRRRPGLARGRHRGGLAAGTARPADRFDRGHHAALADREGPRRRPAPHPRRARRRPVHPRPAQRDPALRAALRAHHPRDHPPDADHRGRGLPAHRPRRAGGPGGTGAVGARPAAPSRSG